MTGKNGKINLTKNNLSPTIILVDSNTKINTIKQFVTNNTKIISFDYESHTLLSKNKIVHTLAENYLSTHDIISLQEKLFHFSKFFTEQEISDMLIYNDVKIGQLFYFELYLFLLPFLKKFLELQKIYYKYPKAEFVSSHDLSDLISLFTTNVIQIDKNSQKSEFFYDSIKLNFRMHNFSFNISIPQRYYDIIKGISDKFITRFLIRHHYNKLTKLSLLVEFDTIKYNKLLTETNSNFILYNRRRPTIWNLESCKIIKRSNVIVTTDYNLENTDVQTRIKNELSKTESIITLLLSKERLLADFFSIGGHSFWLALKPYFIELSKKRVTDAIREIILAEHLFTNYKVKSVLIWSESGFNEQIVAQLGKKYHIPVVLIQHGLYLDTIKEKTTNEFLGVIPILSDKFIVWGNSMRNYALQCGVSTEKIHVIGNPSFDELFEKKETNSSNDYVLLATQSPTNIAVNDLTINIIEKYEKIIKKVCEVVTKLNKNLVIKLHPDPFEFDVTNIAKEINPSIKVIKKGNFHAILKKCEVFIAIDISTTILEANILKKPTISISFKNYYDDEDVCSIFKSDSCIRTEIDNFESTLQRILSDTNFKNQLIQNGNKFVNEYLSNQGTASLELSKLSFN